MIARPLAIAWLVVACAACGDDASTPDAPVNDGAPGDGAASDGAVSDAPGDAGMLLNGCTYAAAQDATAGGAAITFAGVSYTPRCVRIAAGQAASFSGTFSIHPLRAGSVTSTAVTPDPGSPITDTSTGTSASFTFPNAGAFPYYCSFHFGGGMSGVVYVDP